MICVTPSTASDLAELFGLGTDLAGSGRAHIAEYLTERARIVCTPRQAEALGHTLAGHGTSIVARFMHITPAAVQCLLYGTVRAGGTRTGGAVARLRLDLASQGITSVSDIPIPDTPVHRIGLAPAWYAPARQPPDPLLFAALGLLALIVHLADSKGAVSQADLQSACPPAALGVLLPKLRVCGYITYDGGPVVRLIRVPDGVDVG